MPTTQEQVALLTDQIGRLVALTGAVLKGAVPLWVSGGSYVINQIRQSPADQAYYMANTTHSGLTADPSTDAVNWRSFVLDGFAPVSHQHSIADVTDFDEADYATGAEGDLAVTAVQPADLHNVAFSGAYADLSGLPSLDFVPLSGGFMTGDLVIRSGVLNLIKDDGNATASIIHMNRAGSNYVFAPAGGNVTFGQDASIPWAVISEPAVALGSNHVVTRSKGDSRYLQLTGGTLTGLPVIEKTETGNLVEFRRDGTLNGRISMNTSSVSYLTTSDARLKENIVDAEDAGAIVDLIRVRSFDMAHDAGVDHYDYGFVAQELHDVYPDAVSVGDTEEEMWGVDFAKLVPVLVKEIQSLRQRVAALEA